MRVEGVVGIVLAGGRSSRMGVSKAGLEWHGSTLLYRAAALLTRAVAGPVVVVRAPDQVLPPLPAGVAVAVDPVAGLGPMQGIAAGLGAVADRAALAFVCSTDLPFLHPAFVARVLCQLRDTDVDAVVPVAGGYRQPLAAGYRTRLVKLINALLAAGDLRPGMLLAHCAAAMPDDEALLADPELARLDPELASVLNVNTPDDYAAARRRPAPAITVEWTGRRVVPAATLGAAAAAVGLDLDERVVTTVNGGRMTTDPQLPLVAGDQVAFGCPTADAGLRRKRGPRRVVTHPRPTQEM